MSTILHDKPLNSSVKKKRKKINLYGDKNVYMFVFTTAKVPTDGINEGWKWAPTGSIAGNYSNHCVKRMSLPQSLQSTVKKADFKGTS